MDSTQSLLDWETLLHFIPNRSNTDCLQLFTTPTSVNRSEAPHYLKYIEYKKQLYAELQKLIKNGVKKGVHAAPSHQKLTLLYQELAKTSFVKTVCEIGFNIGDSSLAWLTAKPNIVLHSFDIGTRHKTPYMAVLLKKWFGDRFFFHAGSSLITVPMWAAANGKVCDLLSIDGNHDYEFIFGDLVNMRDIAKTPNILVSFHNSFLQTQIKNIIIFPCVIYYFFLKYVARKWIVITEDEVI